MYLLYDSIISFAIVYNYILDIRLDTIRDFGISK